MCSRPTADHMGSLSDKTSRAGFSFRLFLKQKANRVSDLNQTGAAASLFFIALPYSISPIESRCPPFNSGPTPGPSGWDQTQTAKIIFVFFPLVLNPYVT